MNEFWVEMQLFILSFFCNYRFCFVLIPLQHLVYFQTIESQQNCKWLERRSKRQNYEHIDRKTKSELYMYVKCFFVIFFSTKEKKENCIQIHLHFR